MIKDFLILNCIGKNDKIGLKINNSFYIHELSQTINNSDILVSNILDLLKKHKAIINNNFSILVNYGPGSFSSIRTSLVAVKGIKISNKINLFGYKNSDLGQFNLVNIELLIKKKLVQKNLIKPIYLS